MITMTCTTTIRFPIQLSKENQIDLTILPLGILQLRNGNNLDSLLDLITSQKIDISEAKIIKDDRVVNFQVSSFEYDYTHITLIGDCFVSMQIDDYCDNFQDIDIVELSLDESVVTFFKPKIATTSKPFVHS